MSELQESDLKAWKIRAKSLDGYKKVDDVLYHQRLPFVPKIIQIELIRQHYNNLLAGHFGINKTRELIGWKNYWPSLQKEFEAYVKGCDVCLALKTVRHKPYGNLQALPILTYQ